MVGSQCMLAPQPGAGSIGSQSTVPPPEEELEVALELVVVEALVLVELEVLGSPPAPVVAEVVVPVVDELLVFPPAPVVAVVVTVVVPSPPEPEPPRPSVMLVPSAQATERAVRMDGKRAKRSERAASTGGW